MKKIAAHLFIFCFLLINLLFAQTPQGFNYSAVARDATGKPLANRSVSVQLSILKTSPTGALQYAENHAVNTDGYGLFNLVVGSGTVQSGSISNIQWGSANHYLKVDIDANGGSNYISMGTTQIMSVPYALHAKSSDNGIDRFSPIGDTLYLNNGSFMIFPGLSLANISSTAGSGAILDGYNYPSIVLGNGQEWFSENLRSTKYSDGSAIPLVSDSLIWVNNYNNNSQLPMMCWLNNDSVSSIQNNHGALYNWYAINQSTNGNKNLCPMGWHVSTFLDWELLINYLGGYQLAAPKLKSTTGWSFVEGNNLSGFSALPTTYIRGVQNANFVWSDFGWFWTSTTNDNYTTNNSSSKFIYLAGDITILAETKYFGLSVRCIKD
jgi:uncharacterized protein (TIGR02145 family)